MRDLFIPEIGTSITLAKDWTFQLHAESRNEGLFTALGYELDYIYSEYNHELKQFVCNEIVSLHQELNSYGNGLFGSKRTYRTIREEYIHPEKPVKITNFHLDVLVPIQEPENGDINPPTIVRIGERENDSLYTKDELAQVMEERNTIIRVRYTKFRRIMQLIEPDLTDEEFFNKYDGRTHTHSVEFTMPKGSQLRVDRIYIRKGSSDFSSITFFWSNALKKLNIKEIETKNKVWRTSRKIKSPRFWAKLDDVNKIKLTD
jgi:hypothetical protein